MNVGFQEQTFGRHKLSGAPLDGKSEFGPIDLDAEDANGDPMIPENSHVWIAHETSMAGAELLRRSYSYDDGADFTAERWPPWRQGMKFDAGLIFIRRQRDPAAGSIDIFRKMSRFDMMRPFRRSRRRRRGRVHRTEAVRSSVVMRRRWSRLHPCLDRGESLVICPGSRKPRCFAHSRLGGPRLRR